MHSPFSFVVWQCFHQANLANNTLLFSARIQWNELNGLEYYFCARMNKFSNVFDYGRFIDL